MSTSHMPTPYGGGGADAGGRPPSSAPGQAGGAAGVKDHALGEVDDLKVEVAEEARHVGQEARQHLGDVASTAAQELKAQADQQATRAGAGLEDVARQLTAMARRSDEQGVVPDLVASLGTQAEGLAKRMQDGSFDEVVDDVRRFARRRPGLFLLAAAGAGFAASRVLRLSDIAPSDLADGPGAGRDATPPLGTPRASAPGTAGAAPAAPAGIPPIPTTPADRASIPTPGTPGGMPAGGSPLDAPGQQAGRYR